jgi:Ring finger domain
MLSKLSYYTLYLTGATAILDPRMRKYSLGVAACILSNDIIDYFYTKFKERYPQYTITKDIILTAKTTYYFCSYGYLVESLQIMSKNSKIGFVHNGLLKMNNIMQSALKCATWLNITLTSLSLISFPILGNIANRLLNNLLGRINDEINRLDDVNIEYHGVKIFSSINLSPDQIEKIAPLRCAGLGNNEDNKNNDFSNPDKCSVCLDEYDSKMLVRTLPCKHSFHATCADEWIRKNSTCPICRDKLKKYLKKSDKNNSQKN